MKEDRAEPQDDVRVCAMCGESAVKLVISNVGSWKLCDRDSCWNRLTSRHPRTELTWFSQPLDEGETL